MCAGSIHLMVLARGNHVSRKYFSPPAVTTRRDERQKSLEFSDWSFQHMHSNELGMLPHANVLGENMTIWSRRNGWGVWVTISIISNPSTPETAAS